MNHECVEALMKAGISMADAIALRRAAMHLHRWYEAECGSESGGVERDEATGLPYWYNSYSRTRQRVPDREKSALRRVAAIMARYPELSVYHQGDPRGAPLYILRPGDIPAGQAAESYYSRGVAVYK
jgi:hypothetical protein